MSKVLDRACNGLKSDRIRNHVALAILEAAGSDDSDIDTLYEVALNAVKYAMNNET